jgi:hypothetical protein
VLGPTTDLPVAAVDAIARVAAAELGRVAAAVPPTPAAELGRLAQPPVDPFHGRFRSPRPATARNRLDGVSALTAERLLGALELTVAALDLPVPSLVAALPTLPDDVRRVGVAFSSTDSELTIELSKLDAFVPGAVDMVTYVVAELVGHPEVAPLLVGDGADEAAIAAAHGSRHLALAVVAAVIVLRPLWPHVTAPAIVGAAIGVAVPILRTAPMPAAYADAVLAKRRAEYRLPRHGGGQAAVTNHVFTLAEHPFESTVDFSANGLVTSIPGGLAIRTGLESGTVSFTMRVVETPPEPDLYLWQEVVEISWHAPAGGAVVSGDAGQRNAAPPWPGDYRALVSARGRGEDREYYEFVIWPSPAAEPLVHKRSDRLGHQLRGEPEPPSAPDAVYHWVGSSVLGEAATVTFVPGRSSADVLRAFGADPAEPLPLLEFQDRDYQNIDPWVCVLDRPDGVIAVEFNGWQGGDEPVLRGLSSPTGRAASMFWNVNGTRRLSVARDGVVLASFDLRPEGTDSPEVLALLADVDLDDPYHGSAKGLLAATRFTGISLTPEDLRRIAAADVGYAILPLLPELYTEQLLADGTRRWPGHGPLDADTDLLAALPADRLRELAWWAATFAVGHSEISGHPEVVASLAARALTPEAELLARRSGLFEGQHHQLWMALHNATNPDPLGAAIGALNAARYAVPGHAADLLAQARAQVT